MAASHNSEPQYTSEGVIYARYSSHSQRDVSIEQQVKACKLFAERHGIQVLNVYEDRALTGTNDKRPGFQQMIHDAKKGLWNYVIVYTLDRFARDRYDSAVYKRQLKDCGVKVLSAMENISDDPTGVLMESLLEGLAEYYSKELSRKIRRGMEDNASKCLVNGSLPLGFIRGADGRYAIEESEAEIVRDIFRRVKDGVKMSEIISDLNNRRIPTKKGKPWNKSSFNSLLSNERYTGVYIYGDTRIPGGIPQIISPELFNSVQCRLHHKSNPRRSDAPLRRRRDNSIYLLTGKLFCGKCKSPMVGISGKSQGANPYYYYACKGKRLEHSCNKKNVRREHIERFIATALRDTMLTDKAIHVLSEAAVSYQDHISANSELQSLQKQLADVNNSIKNLISAMEAGIFSTSTQSRLVELENQQLDLTRLISVAQEESDHRITADEITATLRLFQNGDVDDKDYQEALIDTFLVAAYVYDNKVRFIFNLGGSKKELEVPFDIDDIEFSGTCISSPTVHQIHPSPSQFGLGFYYALFYWICFSFLKELPSGFGVFFTGWFRF